MILQNYYSETATLTKSEEKQEEGHLQILSADLIIGWFRQQAQKPGCMKMYLNFISI